MLQRVSSHPILSRAQTDKFAECAKINIALKFAAPVFWLVVRTVPSHENPEIIATNMETLEKYLRIGGYRLQANECLVDLISR